MAGTPQSAWISASSSRSQTSGSAGSNIDRGSCCVIARRLLERLSRMRRKRPRAILVIDHAGAWPAPVSNICCQERDIAHIVE